MTVNTVDDALVEINRLRAINQQLLAALIKLTNEATGFLAMSDPFTHGSTNRAVLRDRIRLAQDAIEFAERKAP